MKIIVVSDTNKDYHKYKAIVEKNTDADMLILRPEQEIVNICIHDAVIHCADHAGKRIAVPCGIDSLKALHRLLQLLREMAG